MLLLGHKHLYKIKIHLGSSYDTLGDPEKKYNQNNMPNNPVTIIPIVAFN